MKRKNKKDIVISTIKQNYYKDNQLIHVKYIINTDDLEQLDLFFRGVITIMKKKDMNIHETSQDLGVCFIKRTMFDNGDCNEEGEWESWFDEKFEYLPLLYDPTTGNEIHIQTLYTEDIFCDSLEESIDNYMWIPAKKFYELENLMKINKPDI